MCFISHSETLFRKVTEQANLSYCKPYFKCREDVTKLQTRIIEKQQRLPVISRLKTNCLL